MGTDKIFFIIAILAYGITAVYSVRLWRNRFRHDLLPWGAIPLIAFAAHTLALILRGFSLSSCPIHNLFEACMFIGWTLSLGSAIALFFSKLRFLTTFLSPLLFLLGLFSLIPALDQPRVVPLPQWVSLHATFAFLAYGAYGIASSTAAMYLIQHRGLKKKQLPALTRILPPVQRIRAFAYGMLLTGTLFLTIGLCVGIRGHYQETGIWIGGDIKIFWALALWVYFSLLLAIQRWAHLRGPAMAWCILCGFIFIMLTFWVTSFLSPTHRNRPAKPVQEERIFIPLERNEEVIRI